MTLIGDIARSYRGFGISMTKQLSQPLREERLLMYVVLASLIGYISRVPGLLQVARTTQDIDITVTNLLGTGFVTALFYGPIMLYGLAMVSHMIAKLFKGKGTSQQARLALFWTLLVISPALLCSAAIRAVASQPEITIICHTIVSILFIYCWAVCLSIAEKFRAPYMTTVAIVLIFGLLYGVARVVLVG